MIAVTHHFRIIAWAIRAGALFSLCVLSTAAAADKPRRIVSLNLCTDQLVLQLAQPGRVVSVTYLARDPEISRFAEKAQGLPINHGLAEQILPLRPDLILAGTFTTRPTTALLRRLGYRVELISPATSLDGVRQNIRRVGALLWEEEKAEAMIGEMDTVLARLRPTGNRPAAIVLRPRGTTTGRGSLVDDVMRSAGLGNLSAGLGVTGIGWLSLEQVIAARPRLIILAEPVTGRPSLSHLILRHPAYRAIRDQEGRAPHRVNLPAYLWNCGGPQLAEAAARLSRARQRKLDGSMQP